VERATELLVHSMQETDAPIADISEALARMAAALNDPAADLRAVFARSIAVCVENLQSYDRLMQQLAHARDLLVGSRPRIIGGTARREGTIELF
jgi:ABC-type transporter Mla subunit MlaD